MKNEIRIKDLILPPNLASVARILITPFVGYYLWLGTERATIVCMLLLTFAVLTDFLDGFLARRLNQVTKLGLILDPLADKILTITIIIELIMFRGFPIWLASLILLRDFLIIVLSLKIIKSRDIIPASILTGKYYFGAIAFLLVSYVIRFDFGIWMFQTLVSILLVVSSLIYTKLFIRALKKQKIVTYQDKTAYIIARTIVATIIILIYLYRLYIDKVF